MLFGLFSLIGRICGLGSLSCGPGFSVSFPQILFLLISRLSASYKFMISTTFQTFNWFLVLFGTIGRRLLARVTRRMMLTIVVWSEGRFG